MVQVVCIMKIAAHKASVLLHINYTDVSPGPAPKHKPAEQAALLLRDVFKIPGHHRRLHQPQLQPAGLAKADDGKQVGNILPRIPEGCHGMTAGGITPGFGSKKQ